jgi:predicted acylesterase/phospholipase RssA
MRYDLVFEGGGAKGMAFVGAVAELLKAGHTHDRLLGTSAGAITATLLAAGYTVDEMNAALMEQEDGKPVFSGFMGRPEDFSDTEIDQGGMLALLKNLDLSLLPNFLEDSMDRKVVRALARGGKSRHLVALVERGGWFAARRFLTWMGGKLDAGKRADGTPRKYSGMSLKQFFDATGVDLSMVASDTTEGRLLVLNHRTAPDCPVVYAVRMSMSIPLVWDEVTWRREWGAYRGRDITGHGVVDGGMLSNFPLELFISAETKVTNVMGPKQNTPVLGLMIDESLEVPGAGAGAAAKQPGALAEFALVTRIGRLIDTATTAHDKRVTEEHGELIVRLPAKGYGTTEFDMSEARRNALVEAARQATRAWLVTAPRTVPPMGFGPGAPATKASRRADAIALDLLD